MTRASLISVVLAVCSGVLVAAPLPKDAKPPAFAPRSVGDKRVLQLRSGREMVETVKSVETKDGMRVITLDVEIGGTPSSTQVLGVSDQGVMWLTADGKPLEPPHWIMKLPVKAGEKWQFKKPIAGRLTTLLTHSHETIGEEAVEVPAGKFNAVRVNRKQVRADGTVDMDYDMWLVPDIGVVKSKGSLGGKEYEVVLKSFTPAGKK